MTKISNREAQKIPVGLYEKTCYSLLWQRKSVSISDLTQLKYSEERSINAMKSLVEKCLAIDLGRNKFGLHSRVKNAA